LLLRISDGPFEPRQEALSFTRLKLKGSEEVVAALRRDLDEMNSAFEEGREIEDP
jgi:hypothetical protein